MASDTEHPLAGTAPVRRVLVHVVSPSAEAKRLSFPDTPVTMTVDELKQKIQEVVPSHPLPERQRLIYQGRPLLVPSAMLESVFGTETADTFTLHLVLPLAAPAHHPLRRDASSTSSVPNAAHGPSFAASSAQANAATNGSSTTPLGPTTPPVAFPNFAAGPQMLPQPQQYPFHRPMPFPAGVGGPPPGQNFTPNHANPTTNPTAHPLSGMWPSATNDHMRRAFENHMQQHQEAMRNAMAQGRGQHTNTDPNNAQNTDTTSTGADAAAQGSRADPRPLPPNSTIIHEGHGPNGQWRMVVNQTTLPIPHGHPAAAPTVPTTDATPTPAAAQAPSLPPIQAFAPPMGPMFRPPFPPIAPLHHIVRPVGAPNTAFPPMVYLLSSPSGYEALLVPPAPGGIATNSASPPQRDTTTATAGGEVQVPVNGNNEPEANAQQDRAQQQDEAVDLLRVFFPLGGHLWMLIKLAGLVWLITGGATWTRTIMLSSLALMVFIAQAGWLNPIYQQVAEPLRRHLEGVLRPDQAAEPPAPARPDPAPAGAEAARARASVTPEQLAARILREREEHDPSLLRATARRFERAFALFVASLVPGVGEGHVAARQAAEAERQRREQEHEAEERRRIEATAATAATDGGSTADAGTDRATADTRVQPQPEPEAVAAT